MEPWILLALASAIFSWFANFTVKMIIERGYNSYLYPIWTNLVGFIAFLGVMAYNGNIQNISIEILLFIAFLSFINISLLTTSIGTRVVSLHNIDTVIFYPLYKSFGPIIVTVFSLFYFKEILSPREIVGIAVGISVPLLLITRTENRIQKNLFLWVLFVVMTALLTAVSASVPKVIQTKWLDMDTFLFLAFSIGVIFSSSIYWMNRKKIQQKSYKKAPIYFWIISGIFHLASFYTFSYALTGNLAVVFTINSFSILIPIILSIIFYGEHFSLKKGIVIALSIVSVLLFI